MKRVIIEIGHPGHVHFFKIPIKLLSEQGWEYIIYARNKAETLALLEAEGLRCDYIAKNRTNLGKAMGLLTDSLVIYRLAKQNGANISAGIGAVHSAIASRLMGPPCICFADTEHSIEQAFIYAPNCKAIFSPAAFTRNFGKKHHLYHGYHELSYLHPNYFTPDASILEDYGILDNGPPILLRTIQWSATHDFGVRRKSWERSFIDEFSKEHSIIISAEGLLPKDQEIFRNPLPPEHFHHLLAFSVMYVGPGATTASECAMLGTPAVYTNPLKVGYLSHLESEYGLVSCSTDSESIFSATREFLSTNRDTFVKKQKRMLSESIDVAAYVAKAIVDQSE